MTAPRPCAPLPARCLYYSVDTDLDSEEVCMNSEMIQEGLFPGEPDELSLLVARLRELGRDDDRVEVKSCAGGLGKSVWDSVSAFANT